MYRSTIYRHGTNCSQRLDWLEKGTNFRLLIDDSHVFYVNIKKKGYSIVSTPQLIFDLLREQGVAVEAAHMLIEREYHGIISRI